VQGDLGQVVVDEVGRGGAHAPAHARRAEAATFAAEGDEAALVARGAVQAREAAAEQAAVEMGVELRVRVLGDADVEGAVVEGGVVCVGRGARRSERGTVGGARLVEGAEAPVRALERLAERAPRVLLLLERLARARARAPPGAPPTGRGRSPGSNPAELPSRAAAQPEPPDRRGAGGGAPRPRPERRRGRGARCAVERELERHADRARQSLDDEVHVHARSAALIDQPGDRDGKWHSFVRPPAKDRHRPAHLAEPLLGEPCARARHASDFFGSAAWQGQ
jgi:hypothetical protein